MGIQPPKIDERSYEEIRDEALARIPVKVVEHGQLGVVGAASWYLQQQSAA